MNLKGARILIIDDDPDFVRSTGMILKSAGCQVLEAFSGKEGLEKSRAENPDLYIIDLMMETYSEGFRVVESLIKDENTRDKPRIMITSVDLKGPWDTYPLDEWSACDVLLQKPVHPAELLKQVQRAMA